MRYVDGMGKPERYRLEHVTSYRYDFLVRSCSMSLTLKPVSDAIQRVFDFRIETEPEGSIQEVVDSFGNTKHQLHLYRAHRSLEIAAISKVEMFPPLPPTRCTADAWKTIRNWSGSFRHWDFLKHSELARPSSALARFVRRNDITPGGDPLSALTALAAKLFDCFEYVPGTTTITSPIDDILETGRGVCQDYTHVMIAIARTWGIPARYVSGYIHNPAAGPGEYGGMATHAWAECLLPGLGWTGIDPTNFTLADERHVRLAVGRDYHDVSPTRGVMRGRGDIRITVNVRVRPLP